MATDRPEPPTRREPTRTCVGCRRAESPRAMVRLVADSNGRVALDARAVGGGRGAWVHPSRQCIGAAVKRHAAERGLKLEAQRDLEAGALVASLRDALTRKVASLLVVASRTRTLALGAEAVADALERGRVPVVLAARDAGATASALADDGAEGATRVVRYATKVELGRVFGRGEVALLALLDARIAAELAATIDRLAALED